MADAITGFFNQLVERGHEPLLRGVTGTLRFDVERAKGTDHWVVAVDKGDVAVSHRNAKADCVLHMDEALFDGIARGRVNAMAAMLRGVVDFEGNPGLLVRFQRLFPGPPVARGRRRATGSARRQK